MILLSLNKEDHFSYRSMDILRQGVKVYFPKKGLHSCKQIEKNFHFHITCSP